MRLTDPILHLLKEHAASFPESEVCGFLYSDRYLPLRNIVREGKRFVADPREIARALSRYGEPRAIFHSHPGGNLRPSQSDLARHYYKNSTMIIGGFPDGHFRVNLVQFLVYGHGGY